MNTERFYQLGLDNYFEILELGIGKGKEYHHKFKTKCKKCGFEQWRYDEILRKETSVLRCKNCGNSNFVSKAKPYIKKGYGNRKKLKAECETANGLNDKNKQRIEPDFVSAIAEMYLSGMNQKEIVETTGQSYCVVRYWLKKKGLFDPNRFERGNHRIGAQLYNRQRKQEAETRLAFLLLEKGFLYVGGYEGKNHKNEIRIACSVCGGEFIRKDASSLLKADAIECPRCLNKAKEAERNRRIEAESRRQEEWKQKRIKREEQKLQHLKELHKCKWCGKTFSLEEYRKNEGVQHCEITVFCSSECRKNAERKERRKYNVTHGKHKLRSIKFGVEFDKSINLDEMIRRFGTRCAICGGTCDLTDYEVINGVWIYGNNYPSIDHIKPMSKGGNHSWENVQVAHRLCNSRKGANVV